MTTLATTGTAPVEAGRTARNPRVAIYSICAIFTFLALISIVGSMLFSYPLGGFLGYTCGILLDIGGVGMAYCAYKLPRGRWSTYKLAVGRRGAEFGWSFYKVFIYHESEGTLFFAVTVIALLLLASGPVRRFCSDGRS